MDVLALKSDGFQVVALQLSAHVHDNRGGDKGRSEGFEQSFSVGVVDVESPRFRWIQTLVALDNAA